MNDLILRTLIIIGILIGIGILYKMVGRRFWCIVLNNHVEGMWEPAPGGRDIRRCLYCKNIIRERAVTKTTAQKRL
jgi:hypothetical protein